VASIPLFNPKAQYGPLLPELKERMGAVLDGGRFILGPELLAFEEEAAAFLGVPQTIGVANGTDAISLVLTALGIGAGDEVICPAFTFGPRMNTPESTTSAIRVRTSSRSAANCARTSTSGTGTASGV